MSAFESGAELEERDHWERTARLFAIQTGDIAKARFLLEQARIRTHEAACGALPLFYAIENGHVAMLKSLLEIGTDIEQTDDFGHTALRTAVECCNEEGVDILLRAGANVDHESKTGTALRNASTGGIAMKLLKAGADPQNLTGEARRATLGYFSGSDQNLLAVSPDEFQ